MCSKCQIDTLHDLERNFKDISPELWESMNDKMQAHFDAADDFVGEKMEVEGGTNILFIAASILALAENTLDAPLIQAHAANCEDLKAHLEALQKCVFLLGCKIEMEKIGVVL